MIVRHVTPKTILGVFIFVLVCSSIIMFPINVARQTYYKDKVTVEITYTDRHKAVKLVKSNEYDNWLLQHKGIQPVVGKKISEDSIYCIIKVYSIWTHNN